MAASILRSGPVPGLGCPVQAGREARLTQQAPVPTVEPWQLPDGEGAALAGSWAFESGDTKKGGPFPDRPFSFGLGLIA